MRKTFRARPGAAALRAPLQPGRPRGVGDILPLSAGRPLVCFLFSPFRGWGGCGFCFFNPSGVFFVPSPECFVRLSPHGAKAAYGPGRGAPDRGGPGPVRARSPARDAKKAPRRLFRVPGPGPEINNRGYRQRPAPVAARPGAPADPRGPGPGPHNGPAHALWFFFSRCFVGLRRLSCSRFSPPPPLLHPQYPPPSLPPPLSHSSRAPRCGSTKTPRFQVG